MLIPITDGVHIWRSNARRSDVVRLQSQEGSSGEAIEMLLDRGFGRSPQQLDIAHSVTDRPLEH
jgi:hypothetical protein